MTRQSIGDDCRLTALADSPLLVPRPPEPHPGAPRGPGHSTSARHRKDVAEAADERRAPRAPPDGGSPRDRSRVLPAPSDRGAPRPVVPARRRSAAAPARSPGPDAARRARSPWRTADDPPSPRIQSPDPGSTWSGWSGRSRDGAPPAGTPPARAIVAGCARWRRCRAAVSPLLMAPALAPRSSTAAPHVREKLAVTLGMKPASTQRAQAAISRCTVSSAACASWVSGGGSRVMNSEGEGVIAESVRHNKKTFGGERNPLPPNVVVCDDRANPVRSS